MAFFSEKYGEVVRVVQMGPSIELCGGTHVRTTGQVGPFRFSGQTGVAAGVRRIEAVTGAGALRALRDQEQRLAQVAETLKAQPEHVVRKLEQLLEERQRLEARLAEALRSGGPAAMTGDKATVDGVDLTIAETATDDRAEVGRISDQFREGKRNGVLVLFSTGGRGGIQVTLTDEGVRAGRSGGVLVIGMASVRGGLGGGGPHFASAGAGDATQRPAARAATRDLVSAWLGGRAEGNGA
jgi:alanyl-tRNA synthetase